MSVPLRDLLCALGLVGGWAAILSGVLPLQIAGTVAIAAAMVAPIAATNRRQP